MKNLVLLSVFAVIALGANTSLVAGPGADYFKRVDSVSKSAVAARSNEDPTSKCKVTEVVQITTGPRGMPVRTVVSTNMDCSNCKDLSMPCCASKAKS
jgi:hypothetical protein